MRAALSIMIKPIEQRQAMDFSNGFFTIVRWSVNMQNDIIIHKVWNGWASNDNRKTK